MSGGRRDFLSPLGWLGLGVAVVSLVLPALEIHAPLEPPRTWSLAGLTWASLQAALRHRQRPAPSHWFHEIERLRAQLGHAFPGHHPVPLVFKLGALIPLAMYLALIFTLLSLSLALLRRNSALRGCAVAGVLCAAYAAVISLWLTHAAQAELSQVLSKASAALPFLQAYTSGMARQLQFIPQIGLYLLALGLLAAILAPTPRRLPHAA